MNLEPVVLRDVYEASVNKDLFKLVDEVIHSICLLGITVMNSNAVTMLDI